MRMCECVEGGAECAGKMFRPICSVRGHWMRQTCRPEVPPLGLIPFPRKGVALLLTAAA